MMTSTVLVALLLASAWATENITGEFIATNEWQIIAKGQSIPKGLHVRINLQTGLKEAKLIDKNEGGTSLQEKKVENEPLGLDYKPDVIEESLRKVKEQKQQGKQNYAELKKAYNEFQKNFRTDGELIVELLKQYRNFSKTPIESELKLKMDTLENLEYLLHQIDNALVFIDNAGLDDVLLPIVVNETNVPLRISAMRVLGSLTSNNPKAQIKVFEKNFGSHLAQILTSSTNSGELSAALHAFGSLLRKFPLAQQRILSTSGTQALIRVLRCSQIELRTKAKVITIISDLVQEKRSVLETAGSQDVPDGSSAMAQYVLLEFESWLDAHGYCSTMDNVLSKDFLHLIDQPEIVEQLSMTLDTTENICHPLWSESSGLRHALLTIRNRYIHSKDEYRLELSQILAKICEKLFNKAAKHTEL
ncbi:nucleotide exchange factor Sil1 [Drosophila tropicalis]|uniref:nucleotide exchange factor Sil1 n=1 Tax=Drosophila tropicalis TaxID=46794 RepID=UPI0035ABB2D0